MKRILGIDYGEKRIGIAVSDPLGITAQAVTVLKKDEGYLEKIKELIEKYDVEQIVVGLPKSMSGKIGPQAEKTLAFARELEGKTGISTVNWDERLSTVAAEKILREAELGWRKRKKVIDEIAATYMLQGYLDAQSKLKKTSPE